MKQNTTTAMLLICAVLLGAFIWFFERKSENSRAHELRSSKIFAAYPAEINWVRLERGDSTIECARTAGDEWRMTQPVDAPVNSAIVEKMVAGLANVKRGELIRAQTLKERGLTPSDYGFDKPRAVISFRNNRGTFTWQIGQNTALGKSLYIMSADSRDIISAPRTLLNLVPEDPAWIRDRTLFQTAAAAVNGIDLRRPGGFIRLRQTEENRWTMLQPFPGSADRIRVHQLIDQALTASIRDFITDDPTDLTVYGLEEPAMELSLLDPDEHSETLLIGKPVADDPEAHYATRPDRPTVFTIAAEQVEPFELESTLLRDRQLIDSRPAKISALSIHSDTGPNTGPIELRRTNHLWEITHPAHWKAEPQAVQTLIDTLSNGIVEKFIDSPDSSQKQKIESPLWSITVSAGDKTRTLRIHRASDENRLIVQRDDEPSLCLTDASFFNEKLTDPLFYRSLTLMQLEPPEIKSIELQNTNRSVRLEKIDDTFQTTDGSLEPDSNALAELTAQLIHLRTDRFVTLNPDPLEPYGLAAPAAQLTITLNSTDELGQVILFGRPTEGGRYAMLRGRPAVFIIPEKSAEILTRNIVQPVEKKPTETEQP